MGSCGREQPQHEVLASFPASAWRALTHLVFRALGEHDGQGAGLGCVIAGTKCAAALLHCAWLACGVHIFTAPPSHAAPSLSHIPCRRVWRSRLEKLRGKLTGLVQLRTWTMDEVLAAKFDSNGEELAAAEGEA